jgi:hypothetical protein
MNGLVLLLTGAAGTQVRQFSARLCHEPDRQNHDEYFMEAKRRGPGARGYLHGMQIIFCSPPHIWATVYEPFIHGYTWIRSKRTAKLNCSLFKLESGAGLYADHVNPLLDKVIF